MTCTPYFTFVNTDRSHGPVTSIPIRPELNRLEYALSLGSRDMEWSVTAMARSVFGDIRPAGEAHAAFLLSGVGRRPHASHSSPSQCHPASSVPGVPYAAPDRLRH